MDNWRRFHLPRARRRSVDGRPTTGWWCSLRSGRSRAASLLFDDVMSTGTIASNSDAAFGVHRLSSSEAGFPGGFNPSHSAGPQDRKDRYRDRVQESLDRRRSPRAAPGSDAPSRPPNSSASRTKQRSLGLQKHEGSVEVSADRVVSLKVRLERTGERR